MDDWGVSGTSRGLGLISAGAQCWACCRGRWCAARLTVPPQAVAQLSATEANRAVQVCRAVEVLERATHDGG